MSVAVVSVLLLFLFSSPTHASTLSEQTKTTHVQSDNRRIFLELMALRQLLNQESLYRLDLERQVRELRLKSVEFEREIHELRDQRKTCSIVKGITPIGVSADGVNASSNIGVQQTIDKLFSFVSGNIDQKFEDLNKAIIGNHNHAMEYLRDQFSLLENKTGNCSPGTCLFHALTICCSSCIGL